MKGFVDWMVEQIFVGYLDTVTNALTTNIFVGEFAPAWEYVAKIMNDKLAEFLPNIHERTKKKYWMYLTMNRLHVTPDLYQKMIQSQAYHRLKFYYKKR